MRVVVCLGLALMCAGVSKNVSLPTSEWKLIWADEFDYTGAPNPAKWGYELGKVRNKEEQYYTNRIENASVSNGVLILTAKKESYEGAAYTSASLQTRTDAKDLFSFTGGRIETRAKLAASKGSWPAFWTLGVNHKTVQWPTCGEIDVMENVQRLNNANDPYTIYGSLHFLDPTLSTPTKDKNINTTYDTRKHGSKPVASDWHVYRVDWYPKDRIEWYVDDYLYQTVDLKTLTVSGTPFSDPHYILISYALGGTWAGKIDPDFTSDSVQFDYVRVSQLVSAPMATTRPTAKSQPDQRK